MTSQQLNSDRIAQQGNQIATNQAGQQEQQAVNTIASHINNFWNNSMRKILLQVPKNQLHPLLAKAIAKVNNH